MTRRFTLKLAALALPIALVACGGLGDGGSANGSGNGSGNGNSNGNGNGGPTIGGTITGLRETGLVLTNGTDSVTIPAGATTFALSGAVASGAAYQVAVGTQPLWQHCAVSNGSGTMGGSSVTSVAIACAESIHITTVADRATTSFSTPRGVVVDANGNTYIADGPQQIIRKLAADGTVSSIGTFRTAGANDGAATTATFNGPVGLAVDAAGNVFVADQGNHKIRKIAADGTVSTVAGDGTTAVLSSPAAVAVDAAGNVLVADTGHHRIAKVAPNGAVSTLAGSGTAGDANGVGAAAEFTSPIALALDGDALYVAEFGKNRVRKVAADATVSTLAGAGVAGFADGPGAQATFTQPFALAVRDGNVYVIDGQVGENAYGDRVRRIKPDGTVSTLMPAPVSGAPCCFDGVVGVGTISLPSGLTVDAAGDLVVTHLGANAGVQKISRTEPEVSTFAVMAGGDRLQDVVMDPNGNYYVAAGAVVHKIGPDGTRSQVGTGVAGHADGPAAEAQFLSANALAVDAAGNVFVLDTDGFRIRKIAPDGSVSTFAGSGVDGFVDGPAAEARFSYAYGIAVDGNGNVFVSDGSNRRIRKITPNGTVTTLAGNGEAGTADGVGAAALFTFPERMAVDGSGNLFVADGDGRAVRKVAPDGTVSTLAKPSDIPSYVPGAVTVDANGNVYNFDQDSLQIYRIAADGTVTRLAGSGDAGGTDGPRKSARISNVSGLSLDNRGNLLATVNSNNTIRKISTGPGTVPPAPSGGGPRD